MGICVRDTIHPRTPADVLLDPCFLQALRAGFPGIQKIPRFPGDFLNVLALFFRAVYFLYQPAIVALNAVNHYQDEDEED
jgi:hypothetical protein